MGAEVLKRKIEQLPENLQLMAEGYVDALLERMKINASEKSEVKYNRGYGSLKGKIWMSDDFGESLDDFNEYM